MKKEVSNFMTYEFDHLVIISRDRMEEISDTFHSLGFALTPLSKHNLGSSNRLAILDSCYLEILGWEADSIPIRKEIADEPCGLNALVFRTANADTCYQNLKENGFDPNPIQELTRPVKIGNEIKQAKFKTIRFAIQPILGLRIYFCEHLTPKYVWQPADMVHPNEMTSLREIVIASHSPKKTFLQFQKLLMHQIDEFNNLSDDDTFIVDVDNCSLKIISSFNQQFISIISFLVGMKSGEKDLKVNQDIFSLSGNS